MIKRRFYKRGHTRDSSDSSSSSSDSGTDSDSIAQIEEEEELEEKQEDDQEITVERAKPEIKKNKKEKKRNKRNKRSPSTGSGYESEDSSANEVKVDSSGLLASEEDSIEEVRESIKGKGASKAAGGTLNSNDVIESDFTDCILRSKSVFKCRLCPRIVCLSENTVKAHLNSKRHARSKKLLGEGRLKFMLNSDGEVEEDAETHAERHARTIALAQEPVAAPAKKDTGRRRQSLRRKKKLRNSSNKGKSEESDRTPQKKKGRKNEV